MFKHSILKNSSWNLFSYVVGAAVVFVATPFYIHFLGLDQFGLFTIVFAITAPLGVLNAGMAQATTKYVAEFYAAGETQRATILAGTTLFLNLLLGLLGFFLLILCAHFAATRLFKIAPSLHSEAVWAIRLAGAIWCCNQLSATFQAIVTASQDYRTLALGTISRSILAYGGGVVLLVFSPHLDSLITFNLIVALIFVAVWLFLARRILPQLGMLPRWDNQSCRLCYRFSGWQALDQFLGIWAGQADVFLLGSLTNSKLVGIYGVASNVQSRLVAGVWSALNTLFPATSSLAGSPGAAERMILRVGWSASLAGGWIYGMAFIYAPNLLPLWVGATVGTQAAPVLQILLAAALAGLPSAVLYQYMLGQGLTRLIFLMGICSSIITAACSFICIRQFGLAGAAWGGLAGLVLGRQPILWWVLHRRFTAYVPFREAVSSIFGSQVSTALAVLPCLVIHKTLTATLGPILGLIISMLTVPFGVAGLMLCSELYLIRVSPRRFDTMRSLLQRIFLAIKCLFVCGA
jgi:O-antigen/teichoic acid export membrane protein